MERDAQEVREAMSPGKNKYSHRYASSQEQFDGGKTLGKPRGPCDEKKMKFPMITTPQAPEFVRDANRSSRAHDQWELMAGEEVP